MEFSELLESVKQDINWKVVLKGDTKKIYRQIRKTYFEEVSQSLCRMQVRNQLKLATPSTISNLTTALIEDSDRLFDDTLFLESRKRGIGFLNGVFDLYTGRFRKYNSNDFICDPLPHELSLEPDPEIETWFLNILKSWVGEETGDWFLNLIAYMLFIYPNTENIWVNLFGAGSNGKSLCLELLEHILGDRKCIGTDLQNLNRFSGDAVQGKWLVIGRDSSSIVSDKATSFIKTFSGEKKTLVEKKGGDSFDVPNQGKMIVSTNSLIQSKDRTFAWYRRLFPVLFPNEFPRNRAFGKQLMSKVPEITRVILTRAYKYNHSQTSLFDSVPKPVETLMRETRMMNDRVSAFWESEFFHDENGLLDLDKLRFYHEKSISEMYDIYSQWHGVEFGETGLEPSLKTFGGPYGAFLTTDAGKWFDYKKTNKGRVLALRWEKVDEELNKHKE